MNSKDRSEAAGTRILVQCGDLGAGTILCPAPDGFHGHQPCRVWWVRLDDGRELQVEQCLIQLEHVFSHNLTTDSLGALRPNSPDSSGTLDPKTCKLR